MYNIIWEELWKNGSLYFITIITSNNKNKTDHITVFSCYIWIRICNESLGRLCEHDALNTPSPTEKMV